MTSFLQFFFFLYQLLWNFVSCKFLFLLFSFIFPTISVFSISSACLYCMSWLNLFYFIMSFYIILIFLISFNFIILNYTTFYFILLCHFILSCHFMPFYLIMSFYSVLCYFILFYFILFYFKNLDLHSTKKYLGLCALKNFLVKNLSWILFRNW